MNTQNLNLRGTFGRTPVRPTLNQILRYARPQRGLPEEVNDYRSDNFVNVMRGLKDIAKARLFRLPHLDGMLWAKVIRGNGQVLNLGLISTRVVTDTGVGFLVDAWQNSVELENMKFHGYGTGTGAEAAGNTALGTEFTTEYATDNTRPTGTTTEGASANIFRSVATFAPNGGTTLAVTEHGLFSQAATGGGVLFDRSVFSAVNLVVAQSDSLQTTYEATFPSGS
jgi:hypothetical protein